MARGLSPSCASSCKNGLISPSTGTDQLMKNALTPAEQQIGTNLGSCFTSLSLYVAASHTALHGPQKATLVSPIHIAHVALSHNMQKNIAIVRDSDLGTGSLQGAAIVSAAVVTRLHHDTAPVC
jgi:hypothetical protein